MPRVINPIPTRIHSITDRTDENRDDRGDALKTATGLSSTTAKASGNITFSGLPAENDTITVNGVAFTFKATPAVGTDIDIKLTAAAQAAEVASVLEAYGSGGTGVDAATYTNPYGGTVLVVAKVAGTAGNAITLAESAANTTVSGPTLTGGDSYAGVVRTFMNDFNG